MTEEPTYDVVLLVEKALSEEDAQQVIALHEELETDQQVVYHVLMPVDDAAARVEAAMGSLAAGEVMASPAVVLNEVDLAKVREECIDRSKRQLETTLSRLRGAGAVTDGEIVHEAPIAS